MLSIFSNLNDSTYVIKLYFNDNYSSGYICVFRDVQNLNVLCSHYPSWRPTKFTLQYNEEKNIGTHI